MTKLLAREYELYESPGGSIRRVSIWQTGRVVSVCYERGSNQGRYRGNYSDVLGAGSSIAVALRRAHAHPLADASVTVCLDALS